MVRFTARRTVHKGQYFRQRNKSVYIGLNACRNKLACTSACKHDVEHESLLLPPGIQACLLIVN
jgi:hypothetical protein